jgi:hypothetical protein
MASLIKKAKRVWSRKPEAERKPVKRKPRARADTRSDPPFVDQAKDAVADEALIRINTRMNAALGGFAPTLTIDNEEVKPEIAAARKAAKAGGRSVENDAEEQAAQTAAAHQAALGGFSFAGGLSGGIMTPMKAKANAKD